MATSEQAMQFMQQGLETGKAIPGQSLTNDPQQPYNWEKPAEFTNTKEAMLYVFETLTVPEAAENTLLSINNGVSIIDIASIVLYSGFLEGKWNPDLMTLLMEPTMYMLIALAEKADISYVLDSKEEQGDNEIDSEKTLNAYKKGIGALEEIKKQAVNKVNPQVVPTEVRDIIEDVNLSPSLLEKVEQEKSTSLLGRGR
tara:strand:- start:6246 stop:6842 length:597 start_codon:yes stop_codon:yes gene_type:complete